MTERDYVLGTHDEEIGRLGLYEYFDYASWRMSPRCPELEEFVREVMASWRDHGDEPAVGLDLLRWLP